MQLNRGGKTIKKRRRSKGVKMRVIVVGCGKIGRAILESLACERHDVVAIDSNPEVIRSVTNTYDVMAVCGSATSREMLNAAEVSKCDLFIAVTQSDEVNMLSCFLAKRMGARHTVARIRESEYNEEGLEFLCKQLDLSMALNPERLTAESLFDLLKLPSAVSVDNFAGKKIQILELIVKENSKLCGVVLSDLRKKCPVQFLACAVKRDDVAVIPNGAFCLQEGDKVAFMVKRNDSHKFLKAIGLVHKQGRDVIILGGSSTAYYLAKLLAANNYSVKVVEKDEARCAEFAEKIPENIGIVCGDGTSQDLLLEEGIRSTGALVALTGKDEENILVSCYAISQQVPKVISKVSHGELASLAERLGLDCVVSPQKMVANVLTRYARALNASGKSKMETLYSLMEGDVEASEFAVLPDCGLIGTPLKDLKLKNNLLVASIIRGKETIVPTGDDVILEGDKVIVVATNLHLYDLSDVLR